MKIRVSVVRFRPEPPNTNAQPSWLGVFLCAFRTLRGSAPFCVCQSLCTWATDLARSSYSLFCSSPEICANLSALAHVKILLHQAMFVSMGAPEHKHVLAVARHDGCEALIAFTARALLAAVDGKRAQDCQERHRRAKQPNHLLPQRRQRPYG